MASNTISKVGDILEALARAGAPLTLGDLAGIAKLPKPTVRRLLLQLGQTGLIAQDDQTRRYRLGRRLITLAAAVLDQMDIRRDAIPFMNELVEKTGESVYLAILDEGDVVYVEVIENDRAVRIVTRVGSRRPAHTTATGKALLAFQPEATQRAILARGLATATEQTLTDPGDLAAQLAHIRATGIATTRGEAEPDLSAVAAPILDPSGRAVAALGIGIPTYRFDDETLARLIAAIRETAVRISQVIGTHPSRILF